MGGGGKEGIITLCPPIPVPVFAKARFEAFGVTVQNFC